MKIAVEISRALEVQRTGIPVYQASLFEHLIGLKSQHEFIPLYYGSPGHIPLQFLGADILKVKNPFFEKRWYLKNVADRLMDKPIREAGIDLIHSTAHFTISGHEQRTVLTIHDLIFMLDKNYYNKRAVDFLRGSIGKVRKIIAISKTTKSEVLNQFPFLSEKSIEIVYQGCRSDHQQIKDKETLRRFKHDFLNDENAKYILFFGSFTRRKNILNLLRAFAALIRKRPVDHKLVLAGKPADVYDESVALIKSLELSGKVVLLNYIEEPFLPHLYSAADVFVFPSYYEGFGLPVIEAMQCGCPCVVSNRSSLKELFSDSALTVDPDSTDEIAQGIYKLISDPSLREKYRVLGWALAKKFTWQRTAHDTLRVYESIV